MNFPCGKGSLWLAVVYSLWIEELRVSAPHRATSLTPQGRRRTPVQGRARGAAHRPTSTPGATGKPAPLGRDALLDIVRAVSTTLEPPKVAEVIVDRAAVWMAAARWSCWALVSADLSGELSVL